MRAAVVAAALVLSMVAVAVLGTALGSAGGCNAEPHASVLIRSDADFTAANGVLSGTGTPSDPYVIANLQFKDVRAGYGIKVDNTKGRVTKSFLITCVQSSFTVAAPSGASLVWLVDVQTPTTISWVMSNTGEAPGSIGIRLDGSSYITLTQEDINKYGSDGVQVNASDHITITASKLKAFGNGLTLSNSHDIVVGQTCDLTSGKDCNDFTYDDGRGVYVHNSHDVLVQYTITNADDSGGVLLDGSSTYNVVLKTGEAVADGPICPSSGPTGVVADTISGIAVTNGAHDINVKGYTMQANGDGAGGYFDLMNGGNGMYMNPCTGAITLLPTTTAPGGANLDFNGNCYHFEFGFDPAPTISC